MTGRQIKTVVQKNRVKALDGDWNALKQKLRFSVIPAHERNLPTQIVQKKSGRLIDRTQSLERDYYYYYYCLFLCLFIVCLLSSCYHILWWIKIIKTTVDLYKIVPISRDVQCGFLLYDSELRSTFIPCDCPCDRSPNLGYRYQRGEQAPICFFVSPVSKVSKNGWWPFASFC